MEWIENGNVFFWEVPWWYQSQAIFPDLCLMSASWLMTDAGCGGSWAGGGRGAFHCSHHGAAPSHLSSHHQQRIPSNWFPYHKPVIIGYIDKQEINLWLSLTCLFNPPASLSASKCASFQEVSGISMLWPVLTRLSELILVINIPGVPHNDIHLFGGRWTESSQTAACWVFVFKCLPIILRRL